MNNDCLRKRQCGPPKSIVKSRPKIHAWKDSYSEIVESLSESGIVGGKRKVLFRGQPLLFPSSRGRVKGESVREIESAGRREGE